MLSLSTLLPFAFTLPSVLTFAALSDLLPGERSHQLQVILAGSPGRIPLAGVKPSPVRHNPGAEQLPALGADPRYLLELLHEDTALLHGELCHI